jgi:hypothetical protein
MPDIIPIVSETLLYRRHEVKHWTRFDGRTSPAAFKLRVKKNEKYLSVDIAELSTPQKTATEPISGDVRAASELLAKVPLDLGLSCEHTPSRHNPAHASIFHPQIMKGELTPEYFNENYSSWLAFSSKIVFPEYLKK